MHLDIIFLITHVPNYHQSTINYSLFAKNIFFSYKPVLV